MRAAGEVRARPAMLALRAGITVLLLVLILRKVSFAEIAGALGSARLAPLLGGLALGIAFATLKAYRWGWLLRRLGVPCGEAEAMRSYLGGMAVGLTTPARVGEIARAFYLAARDRAFVAGAALLDKALDVAVILAAGVFGCAAQGYALPSAALAAGAAALIAIPLLPAGALERLARPLPLGPARRHVEALVRPAGRIVPRSLALGLGQAAAAFALTAIQFDLYLSAFGPAPPGATLFVLPLLVLSNLIPVSLSGVGVREWASVILLGRYGIRGAVAVDVALLVYLSNSLAPGVCGALLAPRWRAAIVSPASRAAQGARGA